MVKTLEVMSTEDSASGVSDVSLSNTSAEGALSTSRSWKRRLLFVAAPVCFVAIGYIGMQVFPGTGGGRKEQSVATAASRLEGTTSVMKAQRSVDVSKKAQRSVDVSKKGSPTAEKSLPNGYRSSEEALRIEQVTTHQSLTGKNVGQINEVFLQVVPWKNASKKDVGEKGPHEDYGVYEKHKFTSQWEMVATSQGFFSSKMDFVRSSRTTKECWPAAIPRDLYRNCRFALATKAEVRGLWAAYGLKDLRELDQAVERVRFKRKAMDVLLGSAGRGRESAGRPWASLAASAFGAWFGGAKLEEGAGPWLANQLLKARARNGDEPLVLGSGLQREVLKMPEVERGPYLSGLPVGRGSGDTVVASAYAVIVPLFRLMRELASEGVITVLDMDDFFTGEEMEELFKGLASEQQKQTSVNFVNAAISAASDPSAKARRSGPRFLARCLLRLEMFEQSECVESAFDASRDDEAVRYLQDHIRKDLKTNLLSKLRNSELDIWRGGPTLAHTTIRSGSFNLHDGKKGFELISLLEIIGDNVLAETAQFFGRQGVRSPMKLTASKGEAENDFEKEYARLRTETVGHRGMRDAAQHDAGRV